jgi:hypothetical protein
MSNIRTLLNTFRTLTGEEATDGGDGVIGVSGLAPYWRIRPFNTLPSATSGYESAIEYLEMSVNSAGPNLCVGGSAISNLFDNAAEGFIDGDDIAATLTTGAHNTLDQVWIGYQFPSAVNIGAIRIRNPTGAFEGFAPKCGFIDRSMNGVTWTPTGFFFNVAPYTFDELRTFTIQPLTLTRGTARLWRIRVTASNGSPLQIAELQFRLSLGGASECVGGVPWASITRQVDRVPDRAFDTDNASFWQASSSATGSLGYFFPVGIDPTHYAIRATVFDADQAPSLWAVEYSHDGLTWTIVDDFFVPSTAWGSSELRVFGIP